MFYIFNHDIDKSQIATEAMSANANEILFSGNKEQFESLGFNESQVGGFELVNGELTFNQTLYDNAQKQKRPIASGKDLVSFIEKAFTGQPFTNRMALQGLFAPIKLTLESQTCNLLSEEDFDAVIRIVNANSQLTQEQRDLFIGLANDWKNTVRFE